MSHVTETVLVYPTDNIDVLEKSIQHRKHWFTKDLPERWRTAKPEYTVTEHGEHIMKIYDFEVMSDFQTPYMNKLGENICAVGGHVLNVGFGLGLVDSYIQQHCDAMDSHHIIELNQTVCENAKQWKQKQPQGEKVVLHEGNWKHILPKMKEAGMVFDSVVYDAYPLEAKDLCRDVVDFLQQLLELKLVRERTGIITFYLDSVNGMGNQFQKMLMDMGVTQFGFERVNIKKPNREMKHWYDSFFLAPVLSGLQYPS